MESRAHAFAAGLFVLLCGIAGVAGIWWLSGNIETRSYYLVTQRAVTGLNPQAQVRYRGIRAGKVERIEIDPADRRNILIRISLDASMPLTRGTTAQLAGQGVTGLSYVLLDDAGDNPEPLSAPAGELPRIPLQPAALDSLTEQAGAVARQLAAVATQAGRLLDDKNIGYVSRTLANLADASEGLKEMPRLVAQLKQILSEENLQRLKRILAGAELTLGETAPLARELRGLVDAMTGTAQRLDRVVANVGGETLPQTMAGVDALTEELQRNARQLQRVLEQLERSPQSLLLGRPAPAPGPGEAGFGGAR